MHSFQTQRLNLRPIAECDQALYCQLYTDPEVMRHIAAPLSDEAAQRAFAAALRQVRQDVPPLQVWVVSERGSCGDIGILALIRHGDTADSLELGTMLLASGQGRGLAAEAQAALLGGMFSSMPQLRTVWTRHSPGNSAVVSLMRKLGFSRFEADGPETRWRMVRERWTALCTMPADVAHGAGQG